MDPLGKWIREADGILTRLRVLAVCTTSHLDSDDSAFYADRCKVDSLIDSGIWGLKLTMNRFRSRKKSHDAGEPQRPSLDSDVAPLPSFSSKTFKRGKKALPEARPQEVNLATALPSSDDFRTSLLMPNLSARFSMLREQDDPTSKIGKANDDSVLFPKRASRLNLFGRNNELTDIAEVGSVGRSMRPPLAPWGTASYGSFESCGTEDDGSHSGSVISRARPGEGNTMFGGRQKIYKINVGGSASARNLSGNEEGEVASSKGMGGKVLYGDDVSSSAFQKLREQEKEEQELEASAFKSARSSKERERSNSPPFVNYNHNRETNSSTTSAPSEPRTSTAATSVASQRSMHGGHGNIISSPHAMPTLGQTSANTLNVDRSNTKSRRLYGQGLDQHIYDQQSSAMNRLESLHRQRVASGPSVSKTVPQSRSANNLNERFQRSGPLYASNEFRDNIPSPSNTPPRLADFDLGLADEHTLGTTGQPDSGYGRSPPLSPPMSPVQDPTFLAAIEPNDLGKATASGAFNKPRKQYNEQQYLQRQLQLQQGRETPPLSRPFSPLAPPIDEQSTGRTRDNSITSLHSRSTSPKHHQDQHINEYGLRRVPEHHDPNAELRHANTYHFNKRGNFSVATSPDGTTSKPESESGKETGPHIITARHQELSGITSANVGPARPLDMDHPLYRSHSSVHLNNRSRTPLDDVSETTITEDRANSTMGTASPKGFDTDSPTLGPTNELNGLNGLVRAHLRNDSGQSSIYPEQSFEPDSKSRPEPHSEGYPQTNERDVRDSETFFHKETWDNRESRFEGRSGQGFSEAAHQAMPPPLSLRARHFLDQANVLRNHESSKARQTLGNDKVQRVLGGEAPRTSQESSYSSSWHDQVKHHHVRGGSTETEKERESFANELAQRSRRVRDNLKSFVENESRSASPMPGARNENSPPKQGASFGIRSKNSRGSLAGKHEQPSKAMKLLGISASPINPSGGPRSGRDSIIEDEFDQPAHISHDRKGPMSARPGFQHPNHFQPQRQRDLYDQSQEHLPQRTSPATSKSSKGDRSNFESPERYSNSPNGRNYNDSYKRPEGADRINGYHPDVPHFRKYSNAPRPAPELMESMPSHQIPPDSSQATTSSRLGSSSKTNAAGHFEQRGLSVQTSSLHNPSVSPGTPYSARSASSQHDASPSLPLITTPVMMPPQTTTNATRYTSHRKRSINKQDISDPTFISSTSSVGTVDLPPGASLSNGMEHPHLGHPPPVPPLNPRRKRTQTLRQALGKSEKPESSKPHIIHDVYDEERSTFSADENEPKPKVRQRLRKISSEGGNMNAKARQQALRAPSPALPYVAPNVSVAPKPVPTFSHIYPHPGVQRSPHEMAAAVSISSPTTTFPHPGVHQSPNEVPASMF